ncbi:hypothetical protein ATJ78_1578 [Paramicrobacterium agarici]|uniref:Uncharacterized protein n=1 Tax=Paramicrobacterium agarici TaxID=630514 RepID=A0A2A9DVL5_9MICO|nr:hypothetical protein ATJ78_1578 [Microbacterium agarici]
MLGVAAQHPAPILVAHVSNAMPAASSVEKIGARIYMSTPSTDAVQRS